MHKRELQPRALLFIAVAMLLTALPHFLRIPPLLTGVIVVGLGVKLWVLRKGQLSVNKVILVVLTLLSFGIVFATYGRINGQEPGAALLISMLTLKLVETRDYRDGMICVFMSYFLAAVNFLFTQSIPTAVWMVFQVGLITFTLITLNQDQESLDNRYKARMAGKAVLQALPLMAIMFVLFPRIPGPLWGIPNDLRSSTTGFSESMSPGNFSSLAQSGAVAFRVSFEDDQIPEEKQRYWRGLVLWYNDGRNWVRGRWVRSQRDHFLKQGEGIHYTVTLEPHSNKTLFTLDIPASVSNMDYMDHNHQTFSKRNVTQVYQYKAHSYSTYIINKELSAVDRRKGLQLPEGYNPKAIAMAQRWRDEFKDPVAIAERGLRYFNQEGFQYTLRPPLLGQDSVDDFLFNSRRGFCEHFASSYVTLMRAAGIPARVVVGYQGGEVNPLDNTLVVRQSNAHAWSEIWIEGEGWKRVDPTAAVAPERINDGIEAALPEEDIQSLSAFGRESALKALINIWDAADNAWNQWIVGYDPETQRKFLSRFGLNELYHFIYVLVGIVAAVMGFLLWRSIKPHKSSRPNQAQRYYQYFCRQTAKAGMPRHGYETAHAYCLRLTACCPEYAREFSQLAHAYERLRYRQETPSDLEQLKTLTHEKKLIAAIKQAAPGEAEAVNSVS